jgi:hypothetical protein
VANSLIVGAPALTPSAFGTNRWATIALIGAGLPISSAWFLITLHGWSAMRHAEIASDFTAKHFKHLPNPPSPISPVIGQGCEFISSL